MFMNIFSCMIGNESGLFHAIAVRGPLVLESSGGLGSWSGGSGVHAGRAFLFLHGVSGPLVSSPCMLFPGLSSRVARYLTWRPRAPKSKHSKRKQELPVLLKTRPGSDMV